MTEGNDLILCLGDLVIAYAECGPRWGHAATELNGIIYLFGGYLWCHGIEGFFNDLYELNIEKSCLRRIIPNGASVPEPRFGHTLLSDVTNRRLILFGGRNSSTTFNDVWVYRPDSNTWEEECVQFNNANSDLYRRKDDKFTDRKIRSDEVKPMTRSWHTAVIYNGGMFVHGGWDDQNNLCSDLWRFDLKSMQWRKIESKITEKHGFIRIERSCHVATVYNDDLYIFGGLSGEIDKPKSDMIKFSFKSSEWMNVNCQGQLPAGRTSSASVLCGNDSWLIHGGMADFPEPGVLALESVLHFHFPTHTWYQPLLSISEGLKNSAPRYGHVAIPLPKSNSIVFVGGASKYATASEKLMCRMDSIRTSSLDKSVAAELRQAQESISSMMREISVISGTSNIQIQAFTDKYSESQEVIQKRQDHVEDQMRKVELNSKYLYNTIGHLQRSVEGLEQFLRTFQSAFANFGYPTMQQQSPLRPPIVAQGVPDTGATPVISRPVMSNSGAKMTSVNE